MASGEFVAIGGVAPYTLSLALGSDNRLELELRFVILQSAHAHRIIRLP